ncbi:ABC transporter permease [Acuticoccus sp. I52.16.1]|nr:ABC transporter permease [Acuticoccus sp. I52.16.1]UOM36823.1 ABC transporter permease [Acuticoccus sp. I52.16.1]
MAFFFVGPLILTIIVSFWEYTQYSIEPAVVTTNYSDVFYGCVAKLPDLCVTFKTYLSTLKFCFIVWAVTLLLGFTLAWFIVFEVKKTSTQIALFLICTIPFWTSNVIRMMAWIPLLGRNGLVNQTLMSLGIVSEPQEWLLYSDFAVILAFIHLYTMFMMVPIVNSMLRIDPEIMEAARDAGAGIWTIALSVIAPLCRPGIVIGSIFVITIVMGDYITVGVMGGQQIASVGKTIQVQMQYLQFPIAAANAVVLLGAVLMIIFAMTRLVDVRREL